MVYIHCFIAIFPVDFLYTQVHKYYTEEANDAILCKKKNYYYGL